MLQAAGEQQLPALATSLLELDILPTVAGVLGSYVRQLESEQREFDGGGSGEQGAAGGASPWARPDADEAKGSPNAAPAQPPLPSSHQQQQGQQGEGGGEAGLAPGPAACPTSSLVSSPAVGPEINEAIVIEALRLVDGITATEVGRAAASQERSLVGAGVQLLALCDSTPVRMVCTTLLASLTGIGSLLAGHPGAVRGALSLLGAVQDSAAGTAGTPGEAEVQAAWALLSAALHAACRAEAAGAAEEEDAVGEGAEAEAALSRENGGPSVAGVGSAAPTTAASALLGAATDYSDVLLGKWGGAGGSMGGEVAVQQQRYCLRQLLLLLDKQAVRPGLPEEQAALAQQLANRLADSERAANTGA
jgi:hypothetical protein